MNLINGKLLFEIPNCVLYQVNRDQAICLIISSLAIYEMEELKVDTPYKYLLVMKDYSNKTWQYFLSVKIPIMLQIYGQQRIYLFPGKDCNFALQIEDENNPIEKLLFLDKFLENNAHFVTVSTRKSQQFKNTSPTSKIKVESSSANPPFLFTFPTNSLLQQNQNLLNVATKRETIEDNLKENREQNTKGDNNREPSCKGQQHECIYQITIMRQISDAAQEQCIDKVPKKNLFTQSDKIITQRVEKIKELQDKFSFLTEYLTQKEGNKDVCQCSSIELDPLEDTHLHFKSIKTVYSDMIDSIQVIIQYIKQINQF